ncbi:hypothetical protein J6590_093569, partial [Homalodisca vitripennis]
LRRLQTTPRKETGRMMRCCGVNGAIWMTGLNLHKLVRPSESSAAPPASPLPSRFPDRSQTQLIVARDFPVTSSREHRTNRLQN